MTTRLILRDLQSRFGYLLDAKTELQRSIRNLRKIPFEAEFKILQSLIPGSRCAIDVGANRGQSIDAIRLYHPNTMIHSFEPNKGLFDKLVSKYKSDEKLDLQNLGIGRDESHADLYTPYYRNFMYDGLSSFSKERATDWLNEKTVWRFNPELLTIKHHTCRITRLDAFLYEPFFLKVHVQGFEHDVLEGAKATIRAHKPVLLMANNEAADLWLEENGWTQHVLTDGRWKVLNENDMRIYNSVYLHPRNKDHLALIESLNG